MKSLTLLKNPRGFTLLELLAGTTIFGILLLGVTALSKSSNKSVAEVSSAFHIENLMHTVTLALRNTDVCNQHFAGIVFDPTRDYSEEIEISIGSSHRVLAAAGMPLPGRTELSSVTLTDMTEMSSNAYLATLRLRFRKPSNVEIERTTSLFFDTTPEGNQARIIGCSGGQNDTASQTTVIAEHSLTSDVPQCKPGWTKLWEGYSFVGTTTVAPTSGAPTTRTNQSSDLGKSGSCLETFNPLPVVACPGQIVCETRGLESLWLTTPDFFNNGTLSNGFYDLNHPATHDLLKANTSRCTVCSAPKTVVVKHGFDGSPVQCPANWQQLWSGHSVATLRNYTSHDLASPGSCLQRLSPKLLYSCEDFHCRDYPLPQNFDIWFQSLSFPGVTTNNSLAQVQDAIVECVVCSSP